jgi:transcriptional regulator with XRE-family HTH domain
MHPLHYVGTLGTQGRPGDGRLQRSRIPLPLGAALRDARQRQRLSLRQLAVEVAVSPGHLSCIERGLAAPSGVLARSLIAALSLPQDIATELLRHAVPDAGLSRWSG